MVAPRSIALKWLRFDMLSLVPPKVADIGKCRVNPRTAADL